MESTLIPRLSPIAGVKRRRILRIGLLGLGVVGSGVAHILDAIHSTAYAQCGAEIELAAVAVLHKEKQRAVRVPHNIITNDAWSVATDPEIDVIIEVIGGEEPARSLMREALNTGHHVITANKLVLSSALSSFHALARVNRVQLLYEAAVCGSIPVLRSINMLRQTDEIISLRGIVNGSTNYILTAMAQRGISRDEAIAEARAAGFLEADPTLDLSGADAAQKLAILIHHAFGEYVLPNEIETIGITNISHSDIADAQRRGFTVKLVASAIRSERCGGIIARVAPEEIPFDHPFASTNNELNTIELQTRYAGPQLLSGKGAGSLPTASAIIGDVVRVIRL